MEVKRNKCIQNLVAKHERKIPHGRPRHRWEDNITMKLFLSHIIYEWHTDVQ
jgi:hypothetical protein